MGTDIQNLESLVREGHFEKAAKLLRGIKKSDRKNLAALANIARRINQPQLAIKILHPIVRPTNRLQEKANPTEKIEYAEALRRVGAIDEACQLLSEVDENEFPQASVYKIFCLFNKWKYLEALPILRLYLGRTDLEVYARRIGEINLAAALIQVNELQEAEDLLYQIRAECKKSNFSLLYGNSLELSAQLLILQKNFDGALLLLSESAEVLKESGKIFSLFVEKWLAIAESMKKNRSSQALYDVFLKAKAARHWESVRDCDLYISILDQDQDRLAHLYFGTSFESFRARILKFAGPSFQVSNSYTLTGSKSPVSFFNLASARIEGKEKAHLPTGQALHRFMILLCQDLYRPLSTITAFGKLFPDEYINANTSANRIHQIVKRCREWFVEVNLDFQIEQSDGDYQLIVGPRSAIILPAKPLPLDALQLEWLLLSNQVGAKTFDIHKAKDILISSISKTQRLLRWALSEGLLQKQGKGSGTAYLVIGASK